MLSKINVRRILNAHYFFTVLRELECCDADDFCTRGYERFKDVTRQPFHNNVGTLLNRLRGGEGTEGGEKGEGVNDQSNEH